ncbi:hypothetical protein Q7P37_001958 [Cladosporium fusiforme]
MAPSTRSQTKASRPDDAVSKSTDTDQTSRSRQLRKEEAFSHLPHNENRASRRGTRNDPLEPQRFTIDLSLPPEQRYLEVCATLKDDMLNLRYLFDEVVGGMVKFIPNAVLKWICWILLRGVYDDEENAELKGINNTTGVEMYLLVCFNVLLDLLMGCSSGGAAVKSTTPETSSCASKMVHFRTLDWGMPSLRRVIVHLDYVLEPGGDVFASSITYAGYVGVLTGVRKDLSLSLNFRGIHNDMHKPIANVKYYWHHLMVLLGLRRSISSILRGFLLPRMDPSITDPLYRRAQELPTYDSIVAEATCRHKPLVTTACYLCFSSGRETTVIEKDLMTAKLESSTNFVVVTNADNSTAAEDKTTREAKDASKSPKSELEEILEEAYERRMCAEQNYRKLRARLTKAGADGDDAASAGLPKVEDIVEMVQKYPTTNECTHFAVVMDPQEGCIAWCRYWQQPIGAKWIRNHEG